MSDNQYSDLFLPGAPSADPPPVVSPPPAAQEPTRALPAGPTDLASRLLGMRRSLTGKLREAQDKLQDTQQKLRELSPEELKAGLTNKLAEAAPSPLGLVAKGLLHAATEPGPEALAGEADVYSRDAVTDEAERKRVEDALASRKRMAFILAYVKDPESNPIFKQKDILYKVLSEERGHQQQHIQALEAKERQLPPRPEAMGLTAAQVAADPALTAQEQQREELANKLRQARDVQGQIFALLKSLTGVRGRSGGSGFLPPIEAPVTTEETPSEDAMQAAGSLLAQLKRPKNG